MMKKVIFITFLFLSGILFSQENPKEDLKIGLVLSGGGAKGMAHIGALKVIDEAGIRIDYIGGTSMGAIIGALYASGYSGLQLEEIFEDLDLDEIIVDNIPRSARTFYEKAESERYALTLPFDNFHIKFPTALSKGQNVYNLLSMLLAHVDDIEDFNELPIPFFCIVTNLETGEEVLLDKGYLPRAITASGALPTLFSPVVINDSIYIDGGVTNNYPIDEVRDMGAEIIIGVDVQDSLRTRENLQSGFEILSQITNFNTIRDMKVKRKETDLYIHPDISDFTVVSFAEGRNLINAGVEGTKPYKPDLLALAKRQVPSEKEKIAFNTDNSLFIKNIEIEGNVNYSRAYVMGKLKLRTPAMTTYAEFNEGVNNLSATENFQNIDYQFYEDENGQYTVHFTLIESISKTSLRLAVHYDDLFRTAALINITKKSLITNNDVASFDFIIGDNLRYNFDYYIDKGFYWSIGLNSRFDFFDQDVPISFISPELNSEEGSSLNELDLKYGDLTNQIFVETLFKRSFLLRAGVEHKWLRYLTETIGIDADNNPRTIFEDTNYFSTYGVLKYDTFDNLFFPKRGFYFEGDFHYYLFARGLNSDFDQFAIAKAKASFAHTFFKKLSLILCAEGGFRIGGDSTRSLDFFLGGYGFKSINNIHSFYGYEALSLRGNTYLKTDLTLNYEMVKNHHVNVSVNIANIGDNLFETAQWIDGIDNSGYALGYGWDTFLGPVELKYSYSPETDQGEWYVAVGYRF